MKVLLPHKTFSGIYFNIIIQEVFSMKNDRVKTIARIGMLAAMAYAVMLVFHAPLLSAAPFLKYLQKLFSIHLMPSFLRAGDRCE